MSVLCFCGGYRVEARYVLTYEVACGQMQGVYFFIALTQWEPQPLKSADTAVLAAPILSAKNSPLLFGCPHPPNFLLGFDLSFSVVPVQV